MTTTPLPSFTLEPRESPSTELTRKLLSYLLSGDLVPGQKLPPERALAEALGVGRAAIRNSIKSLALLGLVEQRQGDGTYLSARESALLPQVIEWGILLGERSMSDLIETRVNIEVLLAGLAAQRRTDEQLAEMRSLVEVMRSPASFSAYVESDIAFHLSIARASGNAILEGILGNVQSLLRVWATRVITAADETESSLAMHLPVMDAIEAGDPVRARAAMTALMERAERRLRASMDRAAVHAD